MESVEPELLQSGFGLKLLFWSEQFSENISANLPQNSPPKFTPKIVGISIQFQIFELIVLHADFLLTEKMRECGNITQVTKQKGIQAKMHIRQVTLGVRNRRVGNYESLVDENLRRSVILGCIRLFSQ